MTKEDKQLLIDLDKSHIMTPSLRKLIERFKELATRPPVEIDLHEVEKLVMDFAGKVSTSASGMQDIIDSWRRRIGYTPSHLEAKEGLG